MSNDEFVELEVHLSNNQAWALVEEILGVLRTGSDKTVDVKLFYKAMEVEEELEAQTRR